MTKQIYYSDRGIPLLVSGLGTDRKVLTVEAYCKWYNLYRVFPDGFVDKLEWNGDVQELEYEFIRKHGKSAQGDHCWHPAFVERIAEYYCYELDPLALEMLIGRWFLDHQGKETLAL
jgi:hypothetical protein